MRFHQLLTFSALVHVQAMVIRFGDPRLLIFSEETHRPTAEWRVEGSIPRRKMAPSARQFLRLGLFSFLGCFWQQPGFSQKSGHFWFEEGEWAEDCRIYACAHLPTLKIVYLCSEWLASCYNTVTQLPTSDGRLAASCQSGQAAITPDLLMVSRKEIEASSCRFREVLEPKHLPDHLIVGRVRVRVRRPWTRQL